MSTAGAQDREKPRAFQFADISLRSALDSLMRWYPVSIVYLDRDVEGKKAYASCSDCGFEEALNSVLEGTSLMWMRTGNQVILKTMPTVEPRALVTLWGTVTDSVTGEWIADATVVARSDSGQASPPVQRWFNSRPAAPVPRFVFKRSARWKAFRC